MILAVNSTGAFSANSVITVRCEKVMFSQVFVCPQVHGRRGGLYNPLAGRHPPPPQTATTADGTHPTGMHSSLILPLRFPLTFSANSVITVRCEKVMFSQVFVCPQVHGRRGGGKFYNPPGRQTPPPTDSHYSGRYASYWNAFLFNFAFAISAHIYR